MVTGEKPCLRVLQVLDDKAVGSKACRGRRGRKRRARGRGRERAEGANERVCGLARGKPIAAQLQLTTASKTGDCETALHSREQHRTVQRRTGRGGAGQGRGGQGRGTH